MRILRTHPLVILIALLVVITAPTSYAFAQHRNTVSSTSQTLYVGETKPPADPICPYRLVSWNVHEMSLKKTDATLSLMTDIVRSANIVMLQEVVAGKGMGARRVANLEENLDRTGADWDSITSDPTDSSPGGSERYSYLIRKPFVMNRDRAELAFELNQAIEREPFILHVKVPYEGEVLIANIHTVPTKKKPIREIESLTKDTRLREADTAIVAGDLNLKRQSTDPYFNAIGYSGHISDKTSLGTKLDAQRRYRRNQYDNIYTKGTIVVCSSGVIDFVPRFENPVTSESLKRARNEVSDHLPVFINFGFKH